MRFFNVERVSPSYWVYLLYRRTMHRIEKRKKNSLFCGSLPVKQTHYECCMSDRSGDTAGFITWVVPTPIEYELCLPLPNMSCAYLYLTRVVPTPTEHEFMWVVSKWRRCSACGRFPTDLQFYSEGLYWLMMVLFDGGCGSIDIDPHVRSFWLSSLWFELPGDFQ